MKLPPVLLAVQTPRHELDEATALKRALLQWAVAEARRGGYTNQEIADACGMSEAGVRRLMAPERKR